jgi:ABC-type multidrug transport system fused ATPase/permease subunit
MRRPDRTDTRLLLAQLAPERAQLGALSGVLLVAMLLPVAGPVLLGRAIDRALAGAPVSTITTIALAFLVITLVADGLQLVVTWLAVRLAWRVGNNLRTELARHALRLELAWHSRHSPGLLIERIDGDVDAIVRFSSTAVIQLGGNAVLLLGVLAGSFWIDWRAGLLIACAAGVAVTLLVRLRHRAVPAWDGVREVAGIMYGDIEERLGGLEDLRANGAGDHAVHRLHTLSARWWRASRGAALRGDGAYVSGGAAFSAGAVLTLALGAWLAQRGEITVGSTLAVFRFSQMVRVPLEAIADQMRELQKAAAGMRRAGRLLATEPAIVDGDDGVDLPAGPLSVDLHGVGFAYHADRMVLDDVDLHLDPGTVLGVVGRTGSGKTTISRLLLRFWDATDGEVHLGGVDVRATTGAQLRRRVGVVTQEVELFRASLRDNLTLFGTVEATDDQLRTVLDEVGLGDWAGRLAGGLDGTVDGATRLSAGEAQLLAFARVLLADPGLVLLDEATSRLDPVTEAKVAAATDRLLVGRTVVIIAHRLATLDRVDQIVVIDQGRVVEHGERAALASDPRSRFAHLLVASAARGGPTLVADPTDPAGQATEGAGHVVDAMEAR